MAQLTKGARQLLDLIAADLATITDDADDAIDKTKSNPELSRKYCRDIQSVVRDARAKLEQLEPLLMRPAPQLEQRVNELEKWKTEMEAAMRIAGLKQTKE